MSGNRILVAGAGPFGLGAADRLLQKGASSWTVLEQENRIGGLARSEVDSNGFTWDCAGHVLFSQDDRFNAYLKTALEGRLHALDRISLIRHDGRWVPYPFQNNIHRLSEEKAKRCLDGLTDAQTEPARDGGGFESWILRTFGRGLAEEFLVPYNEKVWAHPLSDMGVYWMKDRVSVVDYKKIRERYEKKTDDAGWGPNSQFFYPKEGGFGGLFADVANRIRPHLQLGTEIVSIDAAKKAVRLKDGRTMDYDWLLSSLPIDQLVKRIPSAPDAVRKAVSTLRFHGIFGVGVGLKKKVTWDGCWAYFPEPQFPFYRVTHLSKYAAQNVPGSDIDHFGSYLCEVPYSDHRPVSRAGLEEACLNGLVDAGLLEPKDREAVAGFHVMDCPYAYPIPTLGRNAALSVVQPWLESIGILSRGRFGTWQYEIGNTDHAFLMGWEAVDRVLTGSAESIYRPDGQ